MRVQLLASRIAALCLAGLFSACGTCLDSEMSSSDTDSAARALTAQSLVPDQSLWPHLDVAMADVDKTGQALKGQQGGSAEWTARYAAHNHALLAYARVVYQTIKLQHSVAQLRDKLRDDRDHLSTLQTQLEGASAIVPTAGLTGSCASTLSSLSQLRYGGGLWFRSQLQSVIESSALASSSEGDLLDHLYSAAIAFCGCWSNSTDESGSKVTCVIKFLSSLL